MLFVYTAPLQSTDSLFRLRMRRKLVARGQRGVYADIHPSLRGAVRQHPKRLRWQRVVDGATLPARWGVIGPWRITWHRPTTRMRRGYRPSIARINRPAWAWPDNPRGCPRWRYDDRMARTRSWPYSRRVRRQRDGVGRPVAADAVAGINRPLRSRQRIVRISAAHPLDVQIAAHNVNPCHQMSPCVDILASLRAYAWRLRCATMPSPSSPTPSSARLAGSGTAAVVALATPL